MTCEIVGNMFVCSRGRRLPDPKPLPRQWKVGDRVVAKVGKQNLPGTITAIKPTAPPGRCMARLKVAVKNPFDEKQWLVQELKDWIFGTSLAERVEVIPALGEEEY